MGDVDSKELDPGWRGKSKCGPPRRREGFLEELRSETKGSRGRATVLGAEEGGRV